MAGGKRVLLELMATGTDAEIREHYMRAAEYRRMVEADTVFVVHFVAGETRKFPLPPEDVHAVFFCHDAAFKRVMMLTPNEANSFWNEQLVEMIASNASQPRKLLSNLSRLQCKPGNVIFGS
jgi:hypothetical protein